MLLSLFCVNKRLNPTFFSKNVTSFRNRLERGRPMWKKHREEPQENSLSRHQRKGNKVKHHFRGWIRQQTRTGLPMTSESVGISLRIIYDHTILSTHIGTIFSTYGWVRPLFVETVDIVPTIPGYWTWWAACVAVLQANHCNTGLHDKSHLQNNSWSLKFNHPMMECCSDLLKLSQVTARNQYSRF